MNPKYRFFNTFYVYRQFREDINEKCPHCQSENSREHIVNDCPYLEKERKRFVEKIGKFGINENTPLRIIEKIYFGQIDNKDLVDKIKSLITIIKEYIRCIYYKYPKRNNGIIVC